MPKEKVSSSDVYEVYLGTFNDNKFTWYSVSKHTDIVEAYKAYKKYVNTQLKYTDEELKKVWDTGRLDVELRQGDKLLNWVGIYSRKVTELTREENREAEEGKKKDKKEKKDEAPYPELMDLKLGNVDKVTKNFGPLSIQFKKSGDSSYQYLVDSGEGFKVCEDDLDYASVLMIAKALSEAHGG